MRVLVAAPYFYDPRHAEFSITSSGFGYMVKDILDAVANHDEVYVFTHQFSDGYSENYTVLKHNKLNVVKTMRVCDLGKGITDAIKNKESINIRLHYLYYQIDKGAFIKAVRNVDPDIIHIHGLTYQTRPFVEACNELNRKYVVTIHGLNGINETVLLPSVEKEYEKKALIELYTNNIPVTVISTGILNKIESVYRINTSNVRVILNGTKFQCQKYSKKDGNKYEIVCIGSISFRKNQTQLIDCLNNMPIHYRNRLHISFYGVDSDGIELDKYIRKKNMQDVAAYRGFVPREEMSEIWKQTDLNVVMSREEGFGLSMIEGFMYGVPTATFSDLDAIADIYNKEAIELFHSRSCEDVQAGIIKCMDSHYNRERIIEWGQHFSMSSTGEQYSNLYKEILRGYN